MSQPTPTTCRAWAACSRPATCAADSRWWCGPSPRAARRPRESISTSGRDRLQLGVFRLGFLVDRNVGVGVFPEGQEILVGSHCLGLISRHYEGSAELQ